MEISGYTFRPGLISSLIVLAMLGLLLWLGVWQLNRAAHKQQLMESYQSRLDRSHVPLKSVDVSDADNHYLRVMAQGRYDATHQVLLDNQVQDGQPGYHVYTPLQIAGMESAVLVNRGWVALGASRQQLPEIPVDTELLSLKGRLSQPANPAIRMGNPSGEDWPRVLPYLDYDQLAAELGYALAPMIILLDPEEPGGFRRDWRFDFAGFGPERHRGYALQWFALALTLMILYIVVNKQHKRSPRAP